MAPDNSPRIKEIFTEAAHLSGLDRVRYLDGICAHDPELRHEVETLLAEADASEEILGWKSVGELLFSGTAERFIFSPGDSIGDSFRIVKLLGAGGMGEVYEADDLRLGGRVAIKTLRSRFLRAPEFAARFRREIQLARRVTHRNICRIFDLGRDRIRDQDVVYVTMELIDGETLAHRLQRGRLLPAQVREISSQLTRGLIALHSANVIHRDMKPSNILLEESESGLRVVITDFGLAHPAITAEDDETLSVVGQVLGTPAYAAPEQLTGKKVGTPADIYALGLVMYEMLTARKPFEGETAFDAAARKLNSKAEPPSQYAAVSQEWDHLVLQCLELDPASRIQSSEDLLAALEALDLTRERPLVPEPTKVPVRRRWSKLRAGLVMGLVVAVSLAFLLLGTGTGAALRRQGCELMPGSALLCALPAIKDMAIFPFTVQGGTEAEKALAAGWPRYIRDSFHRLAFDADKMCIHLRNDRLSEGVRLVMEGSVEVKDGLAKLTVLVRENAPAGSTSKPLLLRRMTLTARLDSAADLELAPLRELARTLDIRYHDREWTAWRQSSPKHASTAVAHLTELGYLAEGKFEKAARQFDSALDPARDFAFPPVHVGLADAYRLMFSATRDAAWELRARRAYERALTLDREFGFSGAERGFAELDREAGRLDSAIRHYTAALKFWPADHPLQKSLVSVYEATGQLGAAEEVLREAARLNPRCWQPHNALGALFSRHSRLRESERSYLELIRLAPDNGSAYHNLAFDYIKMGRFDDAIHMASKSLEVRPYPMAYATLGRAYLYRGCPADALLNVRKAVELDPKYHVLWSTLADTLEMAGGDPGEMIAAARKSAALAKDELVTHPDDAATRARYALNLARTGHRIEALEEARSAARHSPENQQMLAVAAEALERAGQRDEALALVERLLAQGSSISELEKSVGLSALRRDARYSQLLSKMHLDPAADPGGLTPQASGCPSWNVAGKGLKYN